MGRGPFLRDADNETVGADIAVGKGRVDVAAVTLVGEGEAARGLEVIRRGSYKMPTEPLYLSTEIKINTEPRWPGSERTIQETHIPSPGGNDE